MIPSDDREALALTMLGEARNQGDQGMEAVGHVIMNRVAHPSWRGKTVMQVCLKPFQFSCWNIGDPNRSYLLTLSATDPLAVKARDIADKLIAGDLPDFTDGATYYKVVGTNAAWAEGKTPCYAFFAHEFYKDIA